MARAPFQVLVLPYRRGTLELEYAIFRRADLGVWQGIAGGGEDGEGPREAAVRELEEEAGLRSGYRLVRLTAVGAVPVSAFTDRDRWDPALTTIPEYAFGADVGNQQIRLSPEHEAVAWLAFDAAYHQLEWNSNRVALTELNARLTEPMLTSDRVRYSRR